MKVLMIIPSLGAGGAERVLSSLANDWAARNKCDLEIALLFTSSDFYSLNKEIKVHRLNNQGGKKYKYLRLAKLLFKLNTLIKSSAPDVILSFTRESNIITLLASQNLNTKVFISERDSPKAYVSKLYNLFRKQLYSKSQGLIVQTKAYQDFARDHLLVKRTMSIPNPVRDIQCKNLEKENFIINVGRLVPEKGHKYLLESFARCDKKDNWRLVIIGDGPLKEKLQAKAFELKISDCVDFIPNTKDIDKWLCRSSIFAFSSVSEGFPNALAEAMSASLPCVSFDCVTGPSELIVNNISGYLIEVGDTISFSKRLEQLMNSEVDRKRLGVAAKKSTKKLDLEVISEQYFSFISD